MSRFKRPLISNIKDVKALRTIRRCLPMFGLLFLFTSLLYVGVIVNIYYQEQLDHKQEQELSRLEYLLNGKLQHVAHLLYSIDAYLNRHQSADFYEIAQSQLATTNLGLSMETYVLVEPRQFSALETAQRNRGYFDFKIRHNEVSESGRWLVVTKAAPVSEVGQTVGQAEL